MEPPEAGQDLQGSPGEASAISATQESLLEQLVDLTGMHLRCPPGAQQLPADFRLQLQLLECFGNQGKVLEKLKEDQQWISSQLSALQKSSAKQREQAKRDILESIDGVRLEIRNAPQEVVHEFYERNLLAGPGFLRAASLSKNRPLSHPHEPEAASLSKNRPLSHPHEPEAETEVDSNGEMSNAVCQALLEPPNNNFRRSGTPGSAGSSQGASRKSSEDSVKTGGTARSSRRSQITEPEVLSPLKKFRMATQRLVSHFLFDALCACIISANAFFIGLTAQQGLHEALELPGQGEKELESTARNIGHFFVGFYVCELLLKMFAFGSEFFKGPDWKWNTFDLMLVLLAVYDFITENLLTISTNFADVTWLRLLRLLKMLKMLRVVRVMRFFRELRMMMAAIVGSITTLFWSILMLFLMMYIFGLCFLQAVSTYLAETSPEEIDPDVHTAIEMYWGSVLSSIITLFMAVTGGSDWEPLADPLRAAGGIYYALFMFYIAFLIIAVLNVLTGMIVDNTMIVSENDENAVSGEMWESDELICVREHFVMHDELSCETNTVSRKFFEETLDHEDVAAFFNMIEIGPADAKRVFNMLQKENNVDVDEFLSSCMKVKGDTKGIDMISLLTDTKRFMSQFNELLEYVEERFEQVARGMHLNTSPVVPLKERLLNHRVLPPNWGAKGNHVKAIPHQHRSK